MKALLTSLALLAAHAAFAQTGAGDGVDAERRRIAAERSQVEARYAAQEVACYRKFAVNDCLNAARAERRERLSDLRRQELTLNDAERKRRAGERLRSIEERDSAKQQEEDAAQRAESLARFRERQAELASRAAERARKQASAPATPASAPARAASSTKDQAQGRQASRAPKVQAPHDTAEELRRYNERQQEARERRERVARRLAEPRKPEVKPLPVPP